MNGNPKEQNRVDGEDDQFDWGWAELETPAAGSSKQREQLEPLQEYQGQGMKTGPRPESQADQNWSREAKKDAPLKDKVEPITKELKSGRREKTHVYEVLGYLSCRIWNHELYV